MMNITISERPSRYVIEDYHIPAALSSSFAIGSIVISLIVLVLVYRTKPRLHTINHLLICNTCLASILYCVATINNYLFLLFIQWETSDMSCRWRGYFIYAGIAGLMYSYFLQAMSRFCFSTLSKNYRWLMTFKTHYIYICIQWFIVFMIVLPNVLTTDIYFSPTDLCWVPTECPLHTVYTYFAYYLIPTGLIIVIYIYILYLVIKTKKTTISFRTSLTHRKRDLECLRNIVILIGVYLGAGLPTLIADSTSSKIPYLLSLVTQVFAVFIGNLCTIALDRELRQVIKSIIYRTRTRTTISVIPFVNSYPLRKT